MMYFVLHLLNGEVFDFDKKCTDISGLDDNMVRFKNNDGNHTKILMVVPSIQILYIKTMEEIK